jgi:tetratricopeptide (TPR) repeat protein
MSDREPADREEAWEAAQPGAERIAEGDAKGAIDELLALIERDPTNEYAHFHLGSAYYELADYPRALREYVRALELAPTYLGAMINAGHSLRMLGRYEQAIRMAHQVLARDKNDPDGLYLAGAAHFAHGDGKAAERYLEHFLNTRPEPEVMLEVQGMLQVLRGDVVPAETDEPD